MKKNLAFLLLPFLGLSQMDAGNTRLAASFSDTLAVHPVRDAVKVYPKTTHNGTVSVSTQSNGPLHFYIFDLEGTLIHQAVLGNKQKETVRNLKKGMYVYDVFRNDVSIEHGKIMVK